MIQTVNEHTLTGPAREQRIDQIENGKVHVYSPLFVRKKSKNELQVLT